MATPLAIGATVAGGLGLAASSVSVTKEVRRFVERYKSQDIVKIHETIEFHVSRAIRDIDSASGKG